MAFAITQNCCNDASCLSVCPVNCIHPTPDEPDFGKTESLYIDPRNCIDCGACADACPVDAITRVSRLGPDQAVFADINADYFADKPVESEWDVPRFPLPTINELSEVEVAIVGTGPAACYAAQALLRFPRARITFYDRLPTAGGLARFGVAPDHMGTRRIGEHFRTVFTNPRVTMKLGVEVGSDVEHRELSERFDAVVYAVGAERDRRLDIPGIDLPGSTSARKLVGWYTGHPDVPADAFDFEGVERVVLVGNGNVALDAARILTADPADLEGTDIAPHALAVLRRSSVKEVVLVARRGPAHAAFTRSECQALVDRTNIPVVVSGPVDVSARIADLPDSSAASALSGLDAVEVGDLPSGRRIVFSFGRAPAAVGGVDRVESIDIGSGDEKRRIRTELVLLAIGYQGSPTLGLPFDQATSSIRNAAGRVTDTEGIPLEGAYVVGWAKRGATGGIGHNKMDAEETVDALIQDMAGRTRQPATRRRTPFNRVGAWLPLQAPSRGLS
ncbi:FAD-dependent oxidoreductase [Rhodococcus sp. NPDC058521]|uniref:FAD-dependent oxidoreductase n=1 Tax=Rhodococcus sp. NPDC058521 TaxID=3346536 RepID=UPI0036536754